LLSPLSLSFFPQSAIRNRNMSSRAPSELRWCGEGKPRDLQLQ
jgi:hypothetical protein